MTQPFSAKDSPDRQILPEPSEWLSRYGDELYRFALARLGRPHDAEEIVQETLLAALQSRGQFSGRSGPLTWLMGILRRKVADRWRAQVRAQRTLDANDREDWFDARGKWRRWPKRWDDPAVAAERAEFWRVFQGCLAGLPARMGGAFLLRTLDGVAAEQVCRELTISPNNLWVLLHRARLRLMRCLELRWLGRGKP
jgi:RNA polymerase sigma-70 factor (TIGR02943 family)